MHNVPSIAVISFVSLAAASTNPSIYNVTWTTPGISFSMFQPDEDESPSASCLPSPGAESGDLVYMTEGNWVRFAVGGRALADKSSPPPRDDASLAAARELSPLFHVRPGRPPSLLVDGRGDRVVNVSRAERFAAAMRAAGNRSDLALYGNDIGHAFAIAAYKLPEPVVVPAIREADKFLASLGWITGEPTLNVSNPPAW